MGGINTLIDTESLLRAAKHCEWLNGDEFCERQADAKCILPADRCHIPRYHAAADPSLQVEIAALT